MIVLNHLSHYLIDKPHSQLIMITQWRKVNHGPTPASFIPHGNIFHQQQILGHYPPWKGSCHGWSTAHQSCNQSMSMGGGGGGRVLSGTSGFI